MFRRSFPLLVLALGALATACHKDPPPGPSPEQSSNEWIYQQMSEHYLYNDYIRSLPEPDYSLDSRKFFTSLLSTRPGDNDGKHPASSGKDYFYSYLQEAQTRTIGSNVFSYGIEYALYRFTDGTCLARVLYVARHSVAEKAGVLRGDWIEKINATALSDANTDKLDNGGALTLRLGQRDYDSRGGWNWCAGSPRDLSLPAAGRIDNSPLYVAAGPAQLGIEQVGYLVYNEFNSGPGGFSDKTFDDELKTAFRDFKSQGVRQLILDLRYNPGGYTECCRVLSSLIVPEKSLGRVFSVSKYNSARQAALGGPGTEYFLKASEVGTSNLDLSHLWVITGRYTASSSELLINALRPYMKVSLVGAVTEGKNVGSYEIPSTRHVLSLHPITFRSYNSLDESDYQGGFVPQYPLDELTGPGDPYRPMRPLGDTRELLLSQTLSRMGYAPPSKALARYASPAPCFGPETLSLHASIEKNPLRGMIAPRPDAPSPENDPGQ